MPDEEKVWSNEKIVNCDVICGLTKKRCSVLPSLGTHGKKGGCTVQIICTVYTGSVHHAHYTPRRYWIEGGGDRVSLHFAVTFLDCWRTSFRVTTIIKIVNNNTNNKQTSRGGGARMTLNLIENVYEIRSFS